MANLMNGSKREVKGRGLEVDQEVVAGLEGGVFADLSFPDRGIDPHEQALSDTAWVELHVNAWRNDIVLVPDSNTALRESRKNDVKKIGL